VPGDLQGQGADRGGLVHNHQHVAERRPVSLSSTARNFGSLAHLKAASFDQGNAPLSNDRLTRHGLAISQGGSSNLSVVWSRVACRTVTDGQKKGSWALDAGSPWS
jgi:hypothetical protein